MDNKEVLEKVVESIGHHDQMKGSFFFTGRSGKGYRASYDKYHTRDIQFDFEGSHYEYWSSCTSSCNHVYFSDGFIKDGKKVTVRAFKKVRDALM